MLALLCLATQGMALDYVMGSNGRIYIGTTTAPVGYEDFDSIILSSGGYYSYFRRVYTDTTPNTPSFIEYSCVFS